MLFVLFCYSLTVFTYRMSAAPSHFAQVRFVLFDDATDGTHRDSANLPVVSHRLRLNLISSVYNCFI